MWIMPEKDTFVVLLLYKKSRSDFTRFLLKEFQIAFVFISFCNITYLES